MNIFGSIQLKQGQFHEKSYNLPRKSDCDLMRPLYYHFNFISNLRSKVKFLDFSFIFESQICNLLGVLEVILGLINTQEKTDLNTSIKEQYHIFVHVTNYQIMSILRLRLRLNLTSMTSDSGMVFVPNTYTQISMSCNLNCWKTKKNHTGQSY